ncbi:hypothetical protein TNCV_2550431 [Trichonephila clavipes]|nr:hypothetical protein TNCV_2550431 [Trichonephila clavipes]
MRANKYEPIVQEVEIIEANSDYAYVKLGDGRETTVSIRHLAPKRGGELPDLKTTRVPRRMFNFIHICSQSTQTQPSL